MIDWDEHYRQCRGNEKHTAVCVICRHYARQEREILELRRLLNLPDREPKPDTLASLPEGWDQ